VRPNYLRDDKMLSEIVKAFFYACNSYPKISAPHRYSPSDDFEICILSSIIPATTFHENIYSIVNDLKYGRRGVRDLEIGKTIAKSIAFMLRDMGYKISIPITTTSIITTYIDALLFSKIEKEFYEATKKIFTALNLSPVQDTVELFRIFSSMGGEFHRIIELSELTEKRILVEGTSLGQFFELISMHYKHFSFFTSTQKVLEILTLADKLFNESQNINTALSRLFMELAKNVVQMKIDLDKMVIADAIRIDIEMRRKGIDLTHFMPYIMLASFYIVKTKL